MSEQSLTEAPGMQETMINDAKTVRYAPILEKTKELASSNAGMVLITFFIIAGLFIVRQINHHHSDANNTAALSVWNTPVNTVVQPVSGIDSGAKPIAVADNEQMTAPHFDTTPTDITKLTHKVTALSQQLDTTNQHLAAISAQLDALYQNQQAFNKAQAAARAYQLLGTHLDPDTNQYKADIEYNNQVVSKFAGESFGQWVVKKVDAQGAVIEKSKE